MRIFVEPTGRLIAPFNDPMGEVMVGNRPLAEWLTEAIADGGFERINSLEAPCLVVPDTLFATGGALRSFVDQAAGRDAVFVLKRSAFGEGTVPVQPGVHAVDEGWRFDAIRFVSGDDAEPVEVCVDPDEHRIEVDMPNYYTGEEGFTIGIARHPVMTLHHWVHILWANQVCGGIALRSAPKWRGILKVIWAIIRARSINKWRVLGKLNTIGKGCDIHPTAVVEGSTLADGVSVGPFARVLFSTLGEKASVMAGAQVEMSTIGPRSVVSEKVCVRFVTLYPESVASQSLMQQCVLGRRTVTAGGAFSIDLNFDADIRVPLDGALHSTGTKFIGSAFGHRSRVGTGFWLASGRMIPNDYFLIRDPEKVISRVPLDLAGQGPIVAGERTLRLFQPPE